MKKFKKISFISVLVLFFALSFFGFIFARELEVQLPGFDAPTTTQALLPDYIKYIFNMTIMFSGVIVVGVIIFSGVQVLMNAQNPAALGEAKGRIFDALIGVVVVLGAYLLLTTINPQLVIINPSLTGQSADGIKLFDANNKERIITVSQPDLGEFKAIRYQFITNPEGLAVTVFPDKNFLPATSGTKLASTSGSLSSPNSINLAYQKPGVYLCSNSASGITAANFDSSKCFYTTSTKSLKGNALENNINSVIIRNTSNTNYGVILHQSDNYQQMAQIIGSNTQWSVFQPFQASLWAGNDGVSSVTVFMKPLPSDADPGIQTVTLYKNENYDETNGTYTISTDAKGYGLSNDFTNEFWSNKDGSVLDKKIGDDVLSVKINGKNIVLMCTEASLKGNCEATRTSYATLLDKSVYSGRVLGKSSIHSVKIFPIKD